jgi:hypothetical protein
LGKQFSKNNDVSISVLCRELLLSLRFLLLVLRGIRGYYLTRIPPQDEKCIASTEENSYKPIIRSDNPKYYTDRFNKKCYRWEKESSCYKYCCCKTKTCRCYIPSTHGQTCRISHIHRIIARIHVPVGGGEIAQTATDRVLLRPSAQRGIVVARAEFVQGGGAIVVIAVFCIYYIKTALQHK